MTDERYVYNTDIRERKRTASGARAKKGGSRSKRCPLPSDNMTPAQKRKLNGPTVAVNLNKPMTYDQLLELTPTLQFLYLDNLISKRQARPVDLRKMLGISNSTFYRLAKRLPGKLPLTGKRESRSPEWVSFISEAQQAQQEAAQALDEGTPPCTPPEQQNAPTEPTAPTEPHAVILGGSMKVRGTLRAMINAIMCLVDEPEQEYTFTVNFEK